MNYNLGKNSRTESQVNSIAIHWKILKDGLQSVEALGGYEKKKLKGNQQKHMYLKLGSKVESLTCK